MAGMRYQPQGLLRIDRANGLARDLRLVSLPGVSPAVDLVSGAASTVTGTRRATYPGGLTAGFGSAQGVNSTDRIATPLSGATPPERTYLVLARRNGNGGGNVGRLFDKSQGTNGEMAYWEAGTQSFAYHVFANGWAERIIRAPAGQVAASGRDFALAITHAEAGGRTAISIYTNGELATTQDTDGGLTGAPNTPLSIGNRWDGARGWNGTIAAVYVWDRLLAPQEIRELSVSPWKIFTEVEDDDYAAPAVARTLEVERASLTLDVGHVGMRVSRRTRVQPAALAIASGQVTARAARRLSVQAATMTADAGPLRILASRRIVVRPSGLTVAGQGAAVRVGRRMQIAPAPLALAAGLVVMQYSPAMAPGAYTLSVSAAAMTLGGGAVGMRVSRRLPVTAAQLAVAAGAARALIGRQMLVAPAALTLATGQVGARAARRLSVAHASLGLAGSNVQLRYSSQVEYARAPAGAGYAPQRTAISARPAQTGGHRPPATQETTR